MIYLLAKYTLLFLVASLLGFVLGYWFSRRNIEDVSESYEDLRKATLRSDAAQWRRLWMHLEAMPQPEETDLSGVYDRVDSVSTAISELPKPEAVSFDTIETRLDGINAQIAAIPAPVTPENLDLTPVSTKLESLEQRVLGISRPQTVNLAPFDRRLRAIEVELAGLSRRFDDQPQIEEPATPAEPRILSAALYGNKDNLQSISGIGPKLEMLLNHNGIFYFWQIAEWSENDIEVIDERLDAFKGRIERDSWVDQAHNLKRQPEAAQRPASIETRATA